MATLSKSDRRRMNRLVVRSYLEAARPSETPEEAALRSELLERAEDLEASLEAAKLRKKS